MPDSISSVAATRSLSRTPQDLSRENTAAASVEPTIAPSNRAIGQLSPSSHMAARPVRPADSNTPSVASIRDGLSPVRKVAKSVRSPPSTRMTARAMLPTQKLSEKLSKLMPPMPSSPLSMPTMRKTSRKGKPTRDEIIPANTATKISAAAAIKGRARKSSDSMFFLGG